MTESKDDDSRRSRRWLICQQNFLHLKYMRKEGEEGGAEGWVGRGAGGRTRKKEIAFVETGGLSFCQQRIF